MKRTGLLILALLVALGAFADRTRAAETKKIEALIASVAGLEGAKFIRNGKAYDSATAARFLRGKWDRQSRDITTAEEFIERIATRSSTTGRAYIIRFADGRELPTAVFLRAELQKLR